MSHKLLTRSTFCGSLVQAVDLVEIPAQKENFHKDDWEGKQEVHLSLSSLNFHNLSHQHHDFHHDVSEAREPL